MNRARYRSLAITCVIGVALIAGSGAMALSARSNVASLLDEINDASVRALQTTTELSSKCVSAETRMKVNDTLTDIQARLRDLGSPARVVGTLSETCRKHGDMVLEVTPIQAANHERKDPAEQNRRFRLVVSGTYRQVASLLDDCVRQRLPARVIEVVIAPASRDTPSDQLRAEIVVECFRLGESGNSKERT